MAVGEKEGWEAAVERARGLLDAELEEGEEARKWSVKALGKEVGLSESYFCRAFRKGVGCTIGEYRARVQAQRAEKNPLRGLKAPPVVFVPEEEINGSDEYFSFEGAAYPFSEAEMDFFSAVDLGQNFNIDEPMYLSTPEDLSDPSTPNAYDGMEFVDFGAQHEISFVN